MLQPSASSSLSEQDRASRILLNVGGTIRTVRRSGIHRVTVELARALPTVLPTDFVCWDVQRGGLRFADALELDDLFGPGDWPDEARVRPSARQANASFNRELSDAERVWFLDPDIPYHAPGGIEAQARLLSQLREYGVRSAAVAYDLIPILRPEYADLRHNHVAYAAQLVRMDALLGISEYTARQFEIHYGRLGVRPAPRITACPLPDGGFHQPQRAARAEPPGPLTLLLLGTVEPRKGQVNFLEGFANARRRSAKVAAARVCVVGSLHPVVAKRFRQLVAETPGVEYLDYVPEWRLEAVYAHATVGVFASEEEGYGLPVAESLARGLPCLCANFGAVTEIAEGGGCLMVDVRSRPALEEAIVALCEDAALRERLRGEIAGRRWRTWADYAREVVGALDQQPAFLSEAAAETTASTAVLWADPQEVAQLDPAALDRAARADVIGAADSTAMTALVRRLDQEGWPAMLTGHTVVGPAETLAAAIEAAADGVRRLRRRLANTAAVERAYAAARQASPEAAPCGTFLRVAISTFNRRDFVVENARWMLDRVLTPHDGVELVVVDGGSTDGTLEALAELGRTRSRLRVVVSPTNTGMLGGLRDVSRLAGAEYVWILGDDDFIRREAFPEVVAGLRRHAGAPLGFVNFGVYHRTKLGAGDDASRLISECIPLARAPAPSGLLPVRRVAEQHDNLFTAIYPIIWRADVLATAYDHLFDGSPFANLVESIPCTLHILERYAECDSFWYAPVAVVGNAHNGWSRHRPRWHGLLMPQALALARDVGVDGRLLQEWANLQYRLYEEALGLTLDETKSQISPEEAWYSFPLFRKALNLRPPAGTVA